MRARIAGLLEPAPLEAGSRDPKGDGMNEV